MRILVTGGCGFIGSAVCRRLAARADNHVVNLDLLTYAADPRSLAVIESRPNYSFVRGDIRDEHLVSDLLTQNDIDAVVHLAAESHVDRSIAGPSAFLETNVMGTFAILQAVRGWLDGGGRSKREQFRLVHVSTDEVFGDLEPDEAPFSETTRYEPSSPYSASKAASDHLVRAWGRTFDLPAIVTNCSNNYGPFQFPEKLIPLMILTAVQGGQLPVYGDGLNVRDWLHVEDHAAALEMVMLHGKPGHSYNIGGNAERRNIDVVKAICATLDRLRPLKGKSYSSQIAFIKDRPGHDRRYAICSDHIQQTLGWRPQHDFEAGLDATVRWYLDHESWWRPHFKKASN